jgi:peptidoglycan hydrolase CwlO-like protein
MKTAKPITVTDGLARVECGTKRSTRVNGNTVDIARVSEATHRDARGERDKQSIQSEIDGLRAIRDTLVQKTLDNSAKMTAITAEIKSRTLDGIYYRNLVADKARLSQANQKIQAQIREINQSLKPLQSDLFDDQNRSAAHAVGELRREIMGLRTQVRELVAIVKRLSR